MPVKAAIFPCMCSLKITKLYISCLFFTTESLYLLSITLECQRISYSSLVPIKLLRIKYKTISLFPYLKSRISSLDRKPLTLNIIVRGNKCSSQSPKT